MKKIFILVLFPILFFCNKVYSSDEKESNEDEIEEFLTEQVQLKGACDELPHNSGGLYSNIYENIIPDKSSEMFYGDKNVIEKRQACYEMGNLYFTGSIKHKDFYKGNLIEENYNKATAYLAKAADYGLTDAKFKLGEIYYKGMNKIEPNKRLAVDCWFDAANDGNNEARYILGMMFLRGEHFEKNVDRAIEFLDLAASEGYIKAQSELGDLYYEGELVKKDIRQAIKYFGNAAELGDAKAQYRLGELYLKGRIFKKDPEKALMWLTRASEQDYPEANYYMGHIYETGFGVNVDIEKAKEYYAKAKEGGIFEAVKSLAKLGEAESEYLLGLAYFTGKDGIEANTEKSFIWIKESAEKGYPPAQLRAAEMYIRKLGTERDLDTAEKYLMLSKNYDLVSSDALLAELYEIKEGLNAQIEEKTKERNEELFIKDNQELYDLASTENDMKACYDLGIKYFKRGGESDKYGKSKAREYILKAAEKGYEPAQFKLADGDLRGSFGRQDFESAYKWFNESAKKGNGESYQWLGYMAQKGYGLKPNLLQSAIFYEKGAELYDVKSYYFAGKYYYDLIIKQLNTPDVVLNETSKSYLEKAYKWLSIAKKEGIEDGEIILKEVTKAVEKHLSNKVEIDKLVADNLTSAQIEEQNKKVISLLNRRTETYEDKELSDLTFGYLVNLKCNYEASITSEESNYKKRMKELESSLGDKSSSIQIRADNIAKLTLCTGEGYQAATEIIDANK